MFDKIEAATRSAPTLTRGLTHHLSKQGRAAMQSTDSEIWKPIKGYEGTYEVSSEGRIRSLDRVDRIGRFRHGTILRTNGRKYLYVNLYRDGKTRSLRVHRLVLETFVGPCPEGMEGLHWDDNPFNNALSNLRWGTRVENYADSVRNGRRTVGRNGKLSPEDIPCIRERLRQGVYQKIVGEEFGVSQGTIWAIAAGRSWVNA